MSDAQRSDMKKDTDPRLTGYIPHSPTPKQAAFLILPHREAFYGGAGGGGKSDALLMAALQYVDRPDFSALIVRKTFPQLNKPGALIPRSHEWLQGTDAHWRGDMKQWMFPSGAVVAFSQIQHENDRFNFQSAEFDFIAFDEVTDFEENVYRFLFSRLRRQRDSTIPSRMRCASNPGGRGHDWVKARFVKPGHRERPFIAAKIADNPYLDQTGYRESLSYLDPTTRKQIEEGDWTARNPGGYFKKEWFEFVDVMPAGSRVLRYWDLAASEKIEGTDPDWSRGAKGCWKDGRIYISHMAGIRARPGRRDGFIKATAEADGKAVEQWFEQEPVASGVSQIHYFQTKVLIGFTVKGDKPTGDKIVRARPVSSNAEAGNIVLVRGGWNEEYLDEMEAFGEESESKRDQVDATSGLCKVLWELAKPWGFEQLYGNSSDSAEA